MEAALIKAEMKKCSLTDPPPKEDMLDLKMLLVSLKSCIACLDMLSSNPSLLCSPASTTGQFKH
jgi:hypothetical protein